MKVIIVDDECIIRIGLRAMISWEEHGFSIVAEAENGQAALELIKKHQPDIVITDIKMPIMDGLELMHEVMELEEGPCFLVLSNFDDLQYVKDAMRMGAMDYLLKIELDQEQLLECLKKVTVQVEQLNKKPKKLSQADNVQGIKLMQRNILRDIINCVYPSEDYVMDTIKSMGMHLDQGYTYCFMLKTGEGYRFQEVTDHELFQLNFSILNITEELLQENFYTYCLEGKTGEFYIFASNRCNSQEPINEQLFNEILENVIDMLNEYLNITCTVSIGIGEAGLKGIHEAYAQAVLKMRQHLFMNKRRVIYKADIAYPTKEMSISSLFDKKDILFKAIDIHKREVIIEFFENVKKNIQGKSVQRDIACNVMIELFCLVREYAEIYKLNPQDFLKNSMRTYQQLICMVHISEVLEWIDLVYLDIVAFLDKEDNSSYNNLIARVEAFIQEHYEEDISLKQVADEVNLHPAYLSMLLKRYTGMNYTEYITWVRIEEAKKLLIHTDLKVYEVGQKVGYQNTYYFNRIFKKVAGITPGEYKKSSYRCLKNEGRQLVIEN